MIKLIEPQIHGCAIDGLPDGHRCIGEAVYCSICNEILNCSSNESCTVWVETSIGNFCLECFNKRLEDPIDDFEDFALREDLILERQYIGSSLCSIRQDIRDSLGQYIRDASKDILHKKGKFKVLITYEES